MSKTYVLKSWDEVDNHHFISKERWDALANTPLKVEFLDGFLTKTAMIYPKNENPTLGNVFMVVKDDLREVVKEKPTVKKAPTNPKTEKTYTKDDIAREISLLMKDIDDEESAIEYALILGKLMSKFN